MSANEQTSHMSARQFARPVTVEGAPLAPLPAAGGDPAVGETLPQLEGFDQNGDPITLGDGKQAIVLAAPWCPACQQELKELAALDRQGLLPAGLPITLVLTLHDDTRPNWPPDRWLQREGWDRPALVDDLDSSAAAALGLQATPTWILVDSDSRVIHRHAGVLDPDLLLELLAAFNES